MRHSRPIAPQFYVTTPQPCPYLAGHLERKLFTGLRGKDAEQMNNALSKQGFRRSQNVLYRPACPECGACLSARIRTADFKPSKSQRRVLRRAGRLERRIASAWVTERQYALFREYLETRHPDGGMTEMDICEFTAMIEETPVRTRLIEYSQSRKNRPSVLLAVSLTDVLDDGLSMIYTFFSPALAHMSLGTYLILDHIEIAREANLPYVYLGYWIPGSPKMDYKSKFSALEIYRRGEWRDYRESLDYGADSNPSATAPIFEQVARIALPDGMANR